MCWMMACICSKLTAKTELWLWTLSRFVHITIQHNNLIFLFVTLNRYLCAGSVVIANFEYIAFFFFSFFSCILSSKVFVGKMCMVHFFWINSFHYSEYQQVSDDWNMSGWDWIRVFENDSLLYLVKQVFIRHFHQFRQK